MQNKWSEQTLEIVNNEDYLDRLQQIYSHEEGERHVSEEVLQQLRDSFGRGDKTTLLNQLLNVEKFPYKDSYVGFLRKDRSAIDRNPQTVHRIWSRLEDMGIEGIISGVTIPKEANMRRGNQFTDWAKDNFEMLDIDEFKRSEKGVVVLGATEKVSLDFCNTELKVGIAKRPDIVAKSNSTYIIGEAKFLSSTGGNQGRAFEDGVTLTSNSSGNAVKIFILDGIHWIQTGSEQYLRINNSTANIFSVLLLNDFLNDLK